MTQQPDPWPTDATHQEWLDEVAKRKTVRGQADPEDDPRIDAAEDRARGWD